MTTDQAKAFNDLFFHLIETKLANNPKLKIVSEALVVANEVLDTPQALQEEVALAVQVGL